MLGASDIVRCLKEFRKRKDKVSEKTSAKIDFARKIISDTKAFQG